MDIWTTLADAASRAGVGGDSESGAGADPESGTGADSETAAGADPESGAGTNPETGAADYKVGCGKPARHSQFKKGRSGNPRAVRKPMSAPETAVAVLARSVSLKIKKKRRRIAIQEPMLMAQAQKAMNGDHKAKKLLLELSRQAPAPEPEVTKQELGLEIREARAGLSDEQMGGVGLFLSRLTEIQKRRRSK